MINPFWRNTRTEKHHPDPLDTGGNPPAPPASDPPETAYVLCGFCKCELTKGDKKHVGGDIVRMSDDARAYRDQKERWATDKTEFERQIAELRQQVSAKDAEIAALKESKGTKSRFI